MRWWGLVNSSNERWIQNFRGCLGLDFTLWMHLYSALRTWGLFWLVLIDDPCGAATCRIACSHGCVMAGNSEIQLINVAMMTMSDYYCVFRDHALSLCVNVSWLHTVWVMAKYVNQELIRPFFIHLILSATVIIWAILRLTSLDMNHWADGTGNCHGNWCFSSSSCRTPWTFPQTRLGYYGNTTTRRSGSWSATRWVPSQEP